MVIWRTEIPGRVLEVDLVGEPEPKARNRAVEEDPFNAGPVRMTRTTDTIDVLGEAATATEAFDRWPELREFGSMTECKWAGSTDQLTEFFGIEGFAMFRMAPPEGWYDGSPDRVFQVDVNGEYVDFDLMELPWERIAMIEGEVGGFELEYFDGWYRDTNTDGEDKFRQVGPNPDLVADAWDYVEHAEAWPSAVHLVVELPLVSNPADPEVVKRLVTPEVASLYSSVQLNGITVWEEL